MSLITVGWFLIMGIVPQQSEVLINKDGRIDSTQISMPVYSTDIGIEFLFSDRFRLFGDVKTYSNKSDRNVLFNPYRGEYYIGVEAEINNLFFGIKHKCIHPVESNTGMNKMYGAKETEIYVKLSGRMKWPY